MGELIGPDAEPPGPWDLPDFEPMSAEELVLLAVDTDSDFVRGMAFEEVGASDQGRLGVRERIQALQA